jgi:hypothetical protein
MKKFLKITGITLAIILVLLIVLPFVFQGKIVEQVKKTINENVNARVDFGSFSLSFLRSFPHLSVRLDDLSIEGIDAFEGDTLASIERLYVSVNLKSIFSDDGYEVRTIRVDKPRLLLKVLEDGSVNWDIMKEEEVVEETQESGFKLALKKFQVNNGHIVYDDREMNMYTRIENLNHVLSGDFTDTFTTLKIRNTTAERMFLIFDEIPVFNGVFVEFTADIDADLDAFAFTFKDNVLRINDLTANFEGNFAWPDEDMILDFTFSSPQTEFKSFLSIIPAMYAKDFEGLRTSGTMGLSGHVKGVFNDDEIPGFGLKINVQNGMFQYPDLPAAVTDVNIAVDIQNPGKDADLTVVDVSRFALNMGGNPIQFRMLLKTPVSDPDMDGELKGRLDLAKVKDFYPLEEGETLSGIIDADMAAKGRMSSIENERYNEFVFTGNMNINGMNYVSSDFPQGVQISRANMIFSPQFAQLNEFRMKIGDSDMSATGRIDNILGYAISDEVLSGRFETYSSYFNLNQFMEGETTEEEPLSVIEVPANINFRLQSRFDRIVFDNLEITDATGAIVVADQTIRMNNLRMNMLGGTMVLNGSYATHDLTRPAIDFGLNISNFDLQETFNTFNTFAVIAPVGKRASGRFSAGFDLRGQLNENLDPVLPTLAGGGTFTSSSLTIENSPALADLADKLKMDMFRNLNVRDVNVSFGFRDGRVDVQPFDLNLGASKATVSGNHGFDQSINYLLNMAIPRTQFGGAANQALDNLVSQAANRGLNITPAATVNVGVAFTGTVTDPKVNLSLARSADDARQQAQSVIEDAVRNVVDEAKQKATDAVDQGKEQARAELERRADQVMAEADRQAETIRREARAGAENVRREAREQAKRLEDEASGPIAKAAAKRTGDQLIKTADGNATRMEREADQRATNLVNDARLRADKIRAGEE